MNGSYRSNIADSNRFPIGDRGRLLVFECDFSAYHLAFIRAGIGRYFASGSHAVSYIQLGVVGLIELFGRSVLERMVVIGFIRNRKMMDYLSEHGVPCLSMEESVNIGLDFRIGFQGEGTLAAEYFLGEGKYENLGFIGKVNSVGHGRRLREYCRVAEARGLTVERLEMTAHELPLSFGDQLLENAIQKKDAFRRFLSRIRKPAGILCGNDQIAMHTYYAAESMGIRVPEELAILGVGSRDRLKDNWAHIPSVVELDHEMLGYTAAGLMDKYVATGEIPRSVVLKPWGICHGQTTFRRMVGDSVVQSVLMMIQQDPSLDVPTICGRYDLNRKTLDIRFQRMTNMTIAKAIELERFNRAKQLIRRNEFSLGAIASMAGYPSRKGMRRSFYNLARMSPREFRNSSHH